LESAHATGEIADEEVVTPHLGQACAGIERNPSRPVTERANWRNQRECALRDFGHPKPLAIPGTEARQRLPADLPAGVAALYHVDPAREVAAIGVVVGGEEIAHVVEA